MEWATRPSVHRSLWPQMDDDTHRQSSHEHTGEDPWMPTTSLEGSPKLLTKELRSTHALALLLRAEKKAKPVMMVCSACREYADIRCLAPRLDIRAVPLARDMYCYYQPQRSTSEDGDPCNRLHPADLVLIVTLLRGIAHEGGTFRGAAFLSS